MFVSVLKRENWTLSAARHLNVEYIESRAAPPDWIFSEQNRLDCEMNVFLIAFAAAPRLSKNSGERGVIA